MIERFCSSCLNDLQSLALVFETSAHGRAHVFVQDGSEELPKSEGN
jgi:hypothetical protein